MGGVERGLKDRKLYICGKVLEIDLVMIYGLVVFVYKFYVKNINWKIYIYKNILFIIVRISKNFLEII